MDLVNEQDDVARGLHLAEQAFHPLLELAPELGSRHESGQVQKVNLLVLQLGRHLALGDPLGDPLGDGRLAHARLADEAGVILLAAAQNLDGAVDLPVPADDVVDLARPGLLGQVLAVGVQELAAGGLFIPRAAGVLFLLLAREAQREGGVAPGGEALGVVGFLVLAGLAHPHHHGEGVGPLAAHLFQHIFHPVFHVVHVLLGHPELLHQVFHRFDVQLPGAAQAVALLLHLAIGIHPLDKDNGRTLFASNTDHRFLLILKKRISPAQ